MKEAKLADDIMAALKKRPSPDEVAFLGAKYAEAMGDTRHRLEQCVDLIRKEKESAALQEAQFAPPLMDVVDALSFPKSREWMQLMEEAGIPAVAGFDAAHLEMVGALYVKKIDGSDPLYRDLAQAMREKDFDKALVLLQLIRRKNPEDANAATQHEKMEKRVQEDRLERLVTLADADDEGGFAQIMGRFEAEPWERAPQGPKWERALAYKAELEHRQAFAQCIESLDMVKEARQANDWKQASRSLAPARSLLDAYRFTLDDIYRGIMDDATAWVQEEAAAEKAAQAAVARLNRLRTCLRKVQDKELGRRQETTAIREDLAELTSAARDLQEASQSLPEKELQAFNRVLEKLREELTRRQKRRRMLILAGCAALIAIAIPTFLAISASMERDDLLADLRKGVDETSKVNELEAFLTSFVKKNPDRKGDPDFAVLLKRGHGKVSSETKRWTNLQGKVSGLQFQLKEIEDPRKLVPLERQHQSLVDESLSLNGTFSEQAKSALDQLELELSIKRDGVRQGLSGELGDMLAKVQDIAESNATLSMPAAQLKRNLDQLNAALVALETKQQPFERMEGLGLSVGQRDLLSGIRDTYKSRRDTLKTYDRAMDLLDEASSEQLVFVRAERLVQTGLSNDPTVQAAQAMLLKKNAFSGLPASVFLPSAPSRWFSLAEEINAECMPLTLVQAEKDSLNKLLSDIRLKAVYEREVLVVPGGETLTLDYKENEGWVFPGGNPVGHLQKVYTLGEKTTWGEIRFVPGFRAGQYKLKQSIKVITPDGVELKHYSSMWDGANRELQKTDGSVSVSGELLLEVRDALSETLFFPNRSKLAPESSYVFSNPGDGTVFGFVKDNWEEVQLPFLAFLEDLKRAPIDPLVKAFLHRGFMETMKVRPLKWGLGNSPTTKMDVLEDYEKLSAMVWKSDLVADWHKHLLGDTPLLRQQLETFYQQASKRAYLREARFWASFWQQVQPSKFLFHGYCKMDDTWSKKLPHGSHAWGISTKTGGFRIVREGAGEALPLTPLLVYNLNFGMVLSRARQFAGMSTATDPEYLRLKALLPYPFNLFPE